MPAYARAARAAFDRKRAFVAAERSRSAASLARMRTLMTGGSGFVGRHLCRALAARGHEIVNLDLAAPDPALPFARTVVGDVRDPRAVDAALAGCDLVVHLAAAHHDFGVEEATYYDVNENGMHVLCDRMSARGVRRLVFTSSVAVYGDAAAEPDERTVPRPYSPYGASKLAAERVLRAWVQEGDGCRAVVLRPAAIFGEHHFANMYALIRQIASGLYVQVGDGTNRKSLAYVDNVVDAVLFLLARDAPAPLEIYNYADKPDLSSAQLAHVIHDELGRGPPRMRLPLGIALALAAPLDAVAALTRRNLAVSRARIRKLAEAETRFAADAIRAAGFEARVPLEAGLRAMVRWFESEGHALEARPRLPPPTVRPASAATRH
jgi:nucleoside-diphosphate-sugar epimerase